MKKESPKHQSFLRRTVFAGLGVVVPLFLTIYIIDLIIRTTDTLIEILPPQLRPPPEFLFPGHGLVFAFIIIVVTGFFVRNLFGNLVIQSFNNIVERIPLVASIYRLLRQIAEAFLDADENKGFSRVVLVEWPRRGAWMMAFVAADTSGKLLESLPKDDGDASSGAGWLNLFIPSTPNPTTGWFFVVNKDDCIDLDISVDTAFRIIISGGTLSSEDVAARGLSGVPVKGSKS